MLLFLVTSCSLFFHSFRRIWKKKKKKNLIPMLSLLELPELVVDCILEKLPPEGLCSMGSVCRSLRERCRSDHLWEKHMKRKWGGIVGSHIALTEFQAGNSTSNHKPHDYLFSLLINRLISRKKRCAPPLPNSMMINSCYLALETATFCFPAQVYNRQNGDVGFLLSCYDATLTYNRRTHSFDARYPAHGARASVVESGVRWERVRRSPIETCRPHDLHLSSDCLHHLKPGDHLEIQWRRNKDFPYGWWYGVVGHLETCNGTATYCRCHHNKSVVVEFKQYARGSRWRRTILNRKDHREEGNEVDGFYGGIRKLCATQEISAWKNMWPPHLLE